jgi:uncharacterized protein (TIGR02594 family)
MTAVAATEEPPWMTIARKEVGVKEIPGGPNSRIAEYISTVGGSPGDAWCSCFAAWVMEQAGLPLTGVTPAARSWLKWQTPISQPRAGCVVILSRGSQTWTGHVGFLVRWTDKTLTLLGGNQGDAVSIRPYPRSRLLGLRWPKT